MMLVDINLLPQKNENSFQSTLLLIAIVTLFLGISTWIGLSYYVNSSTLQEKESTLQQNKLLVAAQTQKQTEPVISASPLMEKVEYIRGKDIAAVELLNHLVALLPERGYFINYEYKEQNKITIEARFDTLADSTQYLYELTNSPYLTEASIQQMQTTNLEEVQEGKDHLTDNNMLPRYHSWYEIKFQKENLLELKGEE